MFTQSKFETLDTKAQHKKIAELIKKIYFEFDSNLFNHVLELESWINSPWLQGASRADLANAFHKHFQAAGQSLSEHNLLIQSHDLIEPKADWLSAVIYLDHIRSAHNIGNIIRTIEAFRLGQVAFSADMANLSHKAVQKTSMGAYKHVKEWTKKLPKPLIVVETHEKAVPLNDFTFPKEFTLVLGNEEYGVSQEMIEQADHIVKVPLVGQKNSLNVAACFSILAWKLQADLRCF